MAFCSTCGIPFKPMRRGMCENDYRRWLRSTRPKKPRTPTPISQRLLSKMDKHGPVSDRRPDLGPCWVWIGSYEGTGYGKIWDNVRQKLIPAHRASYETYVGEIPDGHEVDHLCFNKGCVNPDHLEAVTPVVNVQRAAAYRQYVTKTHCSKGHIYDEANTRYYTCPSGRTSRYCRACDRGRRHR